MSKKEITNIFGWLDEIYLKKSHPDTFTAKEWEIWNSYMVHRFLSMTKGYIDIVNYVQKMSPQNKKGIYTVYREFIPKKKLWAKYIKNQNKKDYKDLSVFISKYFECGLAEASHYIDILPKDETKNILNNMGIDDKEIKKHFKKAKL